MYTSKDAQTAGVLAWARRRFAGLAMDRDPETFLEDRTVFHKMAIWIAKVVQIIAGSEVIVSVLSFVVTASFHVATFGWIKGIGLTLMLLFHEMGHVWALWRRGYFIGQERWMPVYFIPFVGAILRLGIKFRDENKQDDEAFVGIMGPIAGGVATFIAYLVWISAPLFPIFEGTWFWGAEARQAVLAVLLSSVVFNGFNLVLTVRPFDGGRVTQAISPYLRFVGFGALAILTLFFRQPWIILPWMFAFTGIRFGNEWRRAMLFGVLAAGMTVWSLRVSSWGTQDVFNLIVAYVTVFGSVIYAAGAGVPHYALFEWRAFRIMWKRVRGTYVERSEEDLSEEDDKRIADGVRVPPGAAPEKPWDGQESRGVTTDDPDEKKKLRREKWRWAFFYLITLAGTLLLGAVVYITLGYLSAIQK